jgi:hypothetical protein
MWWAGTSVWLIWCYALVEVHDLCDVMLWYKCMTHVMWRSVAWHMWCDALVHDLCDVMLWYKCMTYVVWMWCSGTSAWLMCCNVLRHKCMTYVLLCALVQVYDSCDVMLWYKCMTHVLGCSGTSASLMWSDALVQVHDLCDVMLWYKCMKYMMWCSGTSAWLAWVTTCQADGYCLYTGFPILSNTAQLRASRNYNWSS